MADFLRQLKKIACGIRAFCSKDFSLIRVLVSIQNTFGGFQLQ
jgi:hypothetical protein